MPHYPDIPDDFEQSATPRSLDFRYVKDTYWIRDKVTGKMHMTFKDARPTTLYEDRLPGSPNQPLLSTPKQRRARMRRRLKVAERLTKEAFDEHYKPIEEWDIDELARGRPRDASGGFRGRKPAYLTREIHERSAELFKQIVRDEMNGHAVTALDTIKFVMSNEDVDDKGKPVVPAGTRLEAAKFLLEHVVGKPVQPTTADISIKLQGILGSVMVNPGELPGNYVTAHQGTRGELTDYVDAEEVDENDGLEMMG